jgi:hypothetical protein
MPDDLSLSARADRLRSALAGSPAADKILAEVLPPRIARTRKAGQAAWDDWGDFDDFHDFDDFSDWS